MEVLGVSTIFIISKGCEANRIVALLVTPSLEEADMLLSRQDMIKLIWGLLQPDLPEVRDTKIHFNKVDTIRWRRTKRMKN